MENVTSLEQAVNVTTDNLKNLLLHLINEIKRLEEENATLKQARNSEGNIE